MEGGGGEEIWGSNASLMRLLVVSAVGAWHWHGVVSQPTKICSACRISAALFCLRPTHRENTPRRTRATYTRFAASRRRFEASWKKFLKLESHEIMKGRRNVVFAARCTQRAACRACCSWSIHLNSCVKVLLFGQFGGVALFVASLLFVLFVY